MSDLDEFEPQGSDEVTFPKCPACGRTSKAVAVAVGAPWPIQWIPEVTGIWLKCRVCEWSWWETNTGQYDQAQKLLQEWEAWV